ncbi:dihydropteroate synthase [Fundidesulfovibrio butyratiphilus]
MSAEHTWILAGGRALELAPFVVMGIVNVTPDSFSDGGKHDAPGAAVVHARALFDQGATILDVGGESTRPFAPPVSQEEETNRVSPVLRELSGALPDACLSVDTYKAETASKALEAGAHIVNDVSACAFDPALLDVVAQHKPGYVLMHSQGRPETMQVEPRYADVVEDVAAFFESGLAMLVNAGLPEDRVVLDPGIGFGKTLEHNLALLAGLGRFLGLGRPVLMGLSRKSLFGQLLGLETGRRDPATQVATALAWERGALVHRVHDVAGAVAALTLARAMAGGRA